MASPIPQTVSARDLLRHCLATIAYRAGKVLRDVPESFAKFQPPEKARTPEQILAHMGDLFDCALSMMESAQSNRSPICARICSGVRAFSGGWNLANDSGTSRSTFPAR